MAWPQKLEADTRCHAKSPTDQELQYSGCVQCGSTVRASTLHSKAGGSRCTDRDGRTTKGPFQLDQLTAPCNALTLTIY